MANAPLRVLIASPLEPEHVDRIRQEVPDVDLLYAPDLLPPTRYIADHHGDPSFRRTPEQEDRWQKLVASADASFDFPRTDVHPHTYASNLRWVQTTSAGVGQLITKLGIAPGELTVTTASGVHARPLTEFVFMVLLMAVKRADHLTLLKQDHRWERFCGDELTGKTIAIVGPGRIGQQVAGVARAFGMNPVALGRDTRDGRAAELGLDRLYTRDELPEMLSTADAVVLCAPHTPETENLMDRAAFDALKPGVVFINIGRGQLVDEAALLDKLVDGTIRLAGLDVARQEPLPADSPFWDLPNVVINPHSASTSIHENSRIVEIFIHNLRCVRDGRTEKMRNVLDISRMY
jgi:phosphoglycerate dehydrogenase-like enzyme